MACTPTSAVRSATPRSARRSRPPLPDSGCSRQSLQQPRRCCGVRASPDGPACEGDTAAMSDLLGHERQPAPRWVRPVVMVAVVALVAALAWRWNDTRDTPSARKALAPSPSGSAEPFLPAPTTGANACGGDVEQPL